MSNLPPPLSNEEMMRLNPDVQKRLSKPAIPPSMRTNEKPPEKQEGLFSSLARGIATTPARFLATGAAAVESTYRAATGDVAGAGKRLAEGYTVPWLGHLEPYKIGVDIDEQDERGMFGKETLDVVGAGAEIASYGFGGGLGGKTLKEAFKRGGLTAAKELIKKNAKYEAIAGLTGGLGYGVQEEDASVGSVLGSGLMGAGLGYGAGAAFPLVGAGLRHLKGSSADDIVNSFIQTATAKEAMTTRRALEAGKPVPEAKPIELPPLYEIPGGEDIFAPPAPDARKLEPKLKEKAEGLGFTKKFVNQMEQMSAQERKDARLMKRLADEIVLEGNTSVPDPQVIAGNSTFAQVGKLKGAHDAAGIRFGEIADSMPNKPIPLKTIRLREDGVEEIIDPLGRMTAYLDENKVKIVKDKNGFIKGLDFNGEQCTYRGKGTYTTEREMLNQSFQELFPSRAKGMDIYRTPKEIINIRQTLEEYAKKLAPKPGEKMSGAYRVIEGLRKDLLQPIGAVNQEFYNVNKTYAVTSGGLDRIYKSLVGKRYADAGEGELREKLSQVIRRLTSDAGADARVELNALRKTVAQVYEMAAQEAKRKGLPVEEMPEIMSQDPQRLAELSHYINDLYDLKRKGGFAKQIEGGVMGAATKLGGFKDMAIGAKTYNPMQVLSGATKLIQGDKVKNARNLLDELFAEGVEEVVEAVPTSPVKPPVAPVRGVLPDEGAIPPKVDGAAPAPKGGAKPPQEAAGALAGIEQEYDEDGNLKGIKFNPGKAAAGIGLMMGITKGKGTKEAKAATEALTKITTKTLEKLKGRFTVSKQFISDLTNAPDLKQPERDLLRKILETQPDKVDVPTFIREVQDELLPLERVAAGVKHEGMATLKSDIRGEIANYSEHVYESPIETTAGRFHYPNFKKYYGHTRIEDIANNDTRRLIEVQSDLYQKGRLDIEEQRMSMRAPSSEDISVFKKRGLSEEAAITAAENEQKKNFTSLKQYNNPTAHFRMIREEVKQAALDGKKKMQVPTGETAMQIEGLGESNQRWFEGDYNQLSSRADDTLLNSDIKTGAVVNDGNQNWIITEVLEDGKFKALNKKAEVGSVSRVFNEAKDKGILKRDALPFSDVADEISKNKEFAKFISDSDLTEQFDISGKIDTSNPIYKFYDKDVGKYLRNKYKATQITDKQGVSWWEFDVDPKLGKAPVEAFGAAAGIEPEYDEEGKMTGIGFNPGKAAAGMGLMMGMSSKVGKNAIEKLKAEGAKPNVKKMVIKDLMDAEGETMDDLIGKIPEGELSFTKGPIHVVDTGEGYMILDGQHRASEALKAGKTEIDTKILSKAEADELYGDRWPELIEMIEDTD